MVLRFAQQQKIQLSEMREPYFFMRNPLAKISAQSISKKFWTTTALCIHWFSLLRKPFLRTFFGLLKTGENLAFLKTKRTKKFPAFHFRQRLAAVLQRSPGWRRLRAFV